MLVTSCYKLLRGSVSGGNEAWGGLMEKQEKSELFFGSFFKQKNLGEIFLYATYAKSTPIFSVIWSELYIQHTLKSKSGR